MDEARGGRAHRHHRAFGPPAPLRWSVVESIPIPDDVKRMGGQARAYIAASIASMEALAASGIKVICYNFMPVVDWCRTDLEWELPNGAKALRFDYLRFAAFELHILERPGAERDYPADVRAKAKVQVHIPAPQAGEFRWRLIVERV